MRFNHDVQHSEMINYINSTVKDDKIYYKRHIRNFSEYCEYFNLRFNDKLVIEQYKICQDWQKLKIEEHYENKDYDLLG